MAEKIPPVPPVEPDLELMGEFFQVLAQEMERISFVFAKLEMRQKKLES